MKAALKITISSIDNPQAASAALKNRLPVAIEQLKARLQSRYEQTLPGKAGQIREVIRAAESAAWTTPFPHLFLPELADEGISRLAAIQPVEFTPRVTVEDAPLARFAPFACAACAA